MGVASSLIESLKFGLSIWSHKEARKYLDEVLKLEEKRHAEINKPEKLRDHNYIDNIDHRLCRITETISKFGKQNT